MAVAIMHAFVHRLATILLFGVVGCAGDGLIPRSPRPPTRAPDYAFGFYNASENRTLDQVKIEWVTDGMLCAAQAGFLPPDPEHHGMGKLDEDQPDPIPPRVRLTWRGPDKRIHERVMEVASKVPDLKGFSGTIYFKYTGAGEQDGWRVIPLSYDEENHLAEQGKPIIPPDPPPTTAPNAGRIKERNQTGQGLKNVPVPFCASPSCLALSTHTIMTGGHCLR